MSQLADARTSVTSIDVSTSPQELGKRAAAKGADAIRQALSRGKTARIILATGVSQFVTLDYLVREPDIDWSRVTAFHLDEYIGLPPDHPASFRRYLGERFVARVDGVNFVPVQGDAPAQGEIARLGALLEQGPVDVCFAGLGENCHLAFNDPPADFETESPFLVVTLDEACRQQQLGEGWFATLDDVPKTALSMSIHQIMRSTMVILSVPERRKAAAVRDMLRRSIDPRYPGAILREHASAHLFLDTEAASLADVAT